MSLQMLLFFLLKKVNGTLFFFQCCLISGESGAGKTVSADYLVRHLAELGKVSSKRLMMSFFFFSKKGEHFVIY